MQKNSFNYDCYWHVAVKKYDFYLRILEVADATTRKLFQRPEITVTRMTGKIKMRWRINAEDWRRDCSKRSGEWR